MHIFREALELAGAVLIAGIIVGIIAHASAQANEYSTLKSCRLVTTIINIQEAACY